MTNTSRTVILNTATNETIEIAGLSQMQILKSVLDTGYKIGRTTLQYLLTGITKKAKDLVLKVIEVVAPVVAKAKVCGVRVGSKCEQIFKLMCEGMTISEMGMKMGMIDGDIRTHAYESTKNKGYTVIKTKVEGRGTVVSLGLNGVAINASQIVYA
jgi:hypothetical protein